MHRSSLSFVHVFIKQKRVFRTEILRVPCVLFRTRSRGVSTEFLTFMISGPHYYYIITWNCNGPTDELIPQMLVTAVGSRCVSTATLPS